jgi:molybdate transport system substrate-binding protein
MEEHGIVAAYMRRRVPTLAFLIVAGLVSAVAARADEVHVLTSGAFTEACRQLAPAFERATGHTMVLGFGPSMGPGADTIPSRLARHEDADVVILAAASLDGLIARGQVVAATRVNLVRSRIGAAVRKGSSRPDIGSVAALKRALLDARSIGYSSSASGVYLSTELFPKLGIADALKPKLTMTEGMVGTLVANGEVELGFQQMSELLPVPGIDVVGPLPDEAQRETIFAAGVVAWAKTPALAKAVLEFFTSPANADLIRKTGLDPIR